MIVYTVYNKATGQILRNGSCQECDFAFQAGDYSIVQGSYDANKFYWADGFVEKGEAPSENHKFDYASKSWVFDEANAWVAIREQRNRLLQQSDWTQNADVDEAISIAWRPYRQALRDITNQPVHSVTWPEAP